MKINTKFYTALLSLFLLLKAVSATASTSIIAMPANDESDVIGTVKLNVSGRIDQVDAELATYFSLGDQISGHIMFSPPSGCLTGNINLPCTGHSVQEIDLKVGKNQFYSNQASENGILILGMDSLQIIFAFPPPNDFLINGLPLNNISMGLDEYQGPVINRTDFVNNQPDYSQFSSSFFRITFLGHTSTEPFKVAVVSSSTFALSPASSVPEPNMPNLMLGGLVILLFLNKRSRRSVS